MNGTAATVVPVGTVEPADQARAMLNILEDLSDEKAWSVDAQHALVNLLDDAAEERARLEATQRGLLNLLDDFDLERHAAEAARLEAEHTNADLEAFSYSVAHDLRAPLRAIAGFSHILSEDHAERLDDEGRRLLGIVVANVTQMGELIDGLLALSRLGRASLSLEDVDMSRLVGSAARELQAFEPDRAVQIEVGELGRARCDVGMVRQAWANLLSNALKFTRDRVPAEITVERTDAGDGPVFSIRDNGVGFDMQYAGKLFGVFERLHSEAEFHGTGVGLAIVRRIVELHGGRIWATGAVGEGAVFAFTLSRGGDQ